MALKRNTSARKGMTKKSVAKSLKKTKRSIVRSVKSAKKSVKSAVKSGRSSLREFSRKTGIGVSDSDRIYKDVMDLLRDMKSITVDVGFLGGETHPAPEGGEASPTTIAQVAAWNEYGTATIPERPFMRRTADTNADQYKRLIGDLLGRALTARGVPRRRLRSVFTVVGAQVTSDVVKTIDDGGFAPNSAATIKRKGSSKPLVDTGVMRAATAFRVKINGSEGSIQKPGGA